MRNADGRRDLSLIRESGSTARVLNLALAFERFGDTEEFTAKPLFRNKRLNRALILKHAVRPHERELFTRPLTSATKVILPYSVKELELGGVSFLIGERRFERIVRDTVEGYDNETDLQADVDDGHVLFNCDDLALDDGTFHHVVLGERLFEHRGEIFAARILRSGSSGFSHRFS